MPPSAIRWVVLLGLNATYKKSAFLHAIHDSCRNISGFQRISNEQILSIIGRLFMSFFFISLWALTQFFVVVTPCFDHAISESYAISGDNPYLTDGVAGDRGHSMVQTVRQVTENKSCYDATIRLACTNLHHTETRELSQCQSYRQWLPRKLS